MRMPAPYKQTKNETNATTEITAGSCYREVLWNLKVSTNGQNPTFLTFLPVRGSENDNDQPHLVV